MTVTFTVPGEPRGKARPRFGKGRTYTPADTRAYEEMVRLKYMESAHGVRFYGPVSVIIKADYSVPKSDSRKQRESKLAGMIEPTVKPDLDNIAKIICDALNGTAYRDDAQVVSLRVFKQYAERAGVAVELSGRGQIS